MRRGSWRVPVLCVEWVGRDGEFLGSRWINDRTGRTISVWNRENECV